VLKEKSSNNTYKLDRQDIAKQYKGKDVRVSGTLDSSDNTIRVAPIEIDRIEASQTRKNTSADEENQNSGCEEKNDFGSTPPGRLLRKPTRAT
jgi:hypothetical protein